jgi:hypothetical protein
MKYVVYVNSENYEIELKEIKKQMKEFLDVGDKVIYLKTGLETHITMLANS